MEDTATSKRASCKLLLKPSLFKSVKIKPHVEIEVKLRPTVSRPVRLGVLPLLGASDQMLHLLE
jgi:hypothetical protein